MNAWQSKYKQYNMTLFIVFLSITLGFIFNTLFNPTLLNLVIFLVSGVFGIGFSAIAYQERVVAEILFNTTLMADKQTQSSTVINFQTKGKELLNVEVFDGYIDNFTLVNIRGSVVRIYQSSAGHYAIVESFLWLKSAQLFKKT